MQSGYAPPHLSGSMDRSSRRLLVSRWLTVVCGMAALAFGWWSGLGANPELLAAEPAARDFTAAARFLEAQDRSELLPEFVAMTRRLDALRGEDCREVFPELAALFEAAA